MPDHAVRAVRGDHVGRTQRFVVPVGVTQRRLHARRALREIVSSTPRSIRTPKRLQMLGEQPLGLGLIEKQQIRIARLQRIEVELREPLAVRITDWRRARDGRVREMA